MSGVAVVIPAAGRGTRLGLDVPKLFAPLGGGQTVWTVLRRRALAAADHVHVVLSPFALPFFERSAAGDLSSGQASFSVQEEPLGMGDAVFKGRARWGGFDHIVVMWGDQVGVSEQTLRRVADALRVSRRPTVVLPLVATKDPYVDYVFQGDRLERVLQSREGDGCRAEGLADVGVFGLGVQGLLDAWTRYEKLGVRGARTGEANFLPFLPYLADPATGGWPVVPVEVADPEEARGINTLEDLAHFQRSIQGDTTTRRGS
ncbi:MAG TPA: NTP transferase domain-containing protein [Polyangiaceae bacterium]